MRRIRAGDVRPYHGLRFRPVLLALVICVYSLSTVLGGGHAGPAATAHGVEAAALLGAAGGAGDPAKTEGCSPEPGCHMGAILPPTQPPIERDVRQTAFADNPAIPVRGPIVPLDHPPIVS